MKVNRQNINESYSITSGWVRDFAKKIEKSSDFLSNVRTVMDKRNHPSSVEEKISDIKHRVGFDLIKNFRDSNGVQIKEAACGDAPVGKKPCCGGCASGSGCDGDSKEGTGNRANHSDDILALVEQLLVYIRNFIKDRDDVSYATVVDHCRSHPNLSWHELSPKIDPEKLSGFIGREINKNKSAPEAVEYIPQDDEDFSNAGGELPEFISHSIS
jgi:hypothetical protein